MSELRKANTDLAYFLTLTVAGWIDVFTRKELATILIEKLRNAQKNNSVAIYSYTVMPSHMHLIAQRTNGELLSNWIRDFKSASAKELYSPEVFYQKMDYIHNNPVAANIVTDPSYYYYSSANPNSPLKVNEY